MKSGHDPARVLPGASAGPEWDVGSNNQVADSHRQSRECRSTAVVIYTPIILWSVEKIISLFSRDDETRRAPHGGAGRKIEFAFLCGSEGRRTSSGAGWTEPGGKRRSRLKVMAFVAPDLFEGALARSPRPRRSRLSWTFETSARWPPPGARSLSVVRPQDSSHIRLSIWF